MFERKLKNPFTAGTRQWPAFIWPCILVGASVVTLLLLWMLGAQAMVLPLAHLMDRVFGTLAAGFMIISLIMVVLADNIDEVDPTRQRLSVQASQFAKWAQLLSLLWLLAAVVHLWADFASLSSTGSGDFVDYLTHSWSGQRLGLQVVLIVLALAAASWIRPDLLAAGTFLGLAALALLAAALAPAEMFDALGQWLRVAHVLPASCWVGGLCGVIVAARQLGHTDPHLLRIVRIYSDIALTAAASVVVSGIGLALAWLKYHPGIFVDSADGRLIITKFVALVLLLAAGALHRQRSMRELAQGRESTFRRLCLAELIVMGVAYGLSIALVDNAF